MTDFTCQSTFDEDEGAQPKGATALLLQDPKKRELWENHSRGIDEADQRSSAQTCQSGLNLVV